MTMFLKQKIVIKQGGSLHPLKAGFVNSMSIFRKQRFYIMD